MKRVLVYGLALTMSVSLLGCSPSENKIAGAESQIEEEVDVDVENLEEVRSLVEDFGERLKLVSLLAPEDLVKESMEENYGELVSSDLMEEWLKEPENAPGRLVSSPWPDHIEILEIEKISENQYDVEGKIVEITASEDEEGLTCPISLTVENIDGNWLIKDVILGQYDE